MEPLKDELKDLRRQTDTRSPDVIFMLDEGDFASDLSESRASRVLTPRQRARLRESQGLYSY